MVADRRSHRGAAPAGTTIRDLGSPRVARARGRRRRGAAAVERGDHRRGHHRRARAAPDPATGGRRRSHRSRCGDRARDPGLQRARHESRRRSPSTRCFCCSRSRAARRSRSARSPQRQIGVPLGIELAGKTLGIVGPRPLGLRARRARTCLGMTVIALGRDATTAEREAFFAACDAISLHCPLDAADARPARRHRVRRDATWRADRQLRARWRHRSRRARSPRSPRTGSVASGSTCTGTSRRIPAIRCTPIHA